MQREVIQLQKDLDKSEDDLKALQSVGQMIGEVLKRLDDERCMISFLFFIKSTIINFVFKNSHC